MAKFINFQEFKKAVAESADVVKYLSEELAASLRDLKKGLLKLDFADNFESFETTVTLTAGQTLPIRNQLRSGLIPTKRIITRVTGTPLIVDGVWDKNFLRLTNAGAVSATITVIFMR